MKRRQAFVLSLFICLILHCHILLALSSSSSSSSITPPSHHHLLSRLRLLQQKSEAQADAAFHRAQHHQLDAEDVLMETGSSESESESEGEEGEMEESSTAADEIQSSASSSDSNLIQTNENLLNEALASQYELQDVTHYVDDDSALLDLESELESEQDPPTDSPPPPNSPPGGDSTPSSPSTPPATDGGAKPNPTYILPYPPIIPTSYTPLFNPYNNVNPLSTPYVNPHHIYPLPPASHYTLTPAEYHRAEAAAAHAAMLAHSHSGYSHRANELARRSHRHAVASRRHAVAAVEAANAARWESSAAVYPYNVMQYRHPVIAAQLQGNPVHHAYEYGLIPPQHWNGAAVGGNPTAASLDAPPTTPPKATSEQSTGFLEVESSDTAEQLECRGCSYRED